MGMLTISESPCPHQKTQVPIHRYIVTVEGSMHVKCSTEHQAQDEHLNVHLKTPQTQVFAHICINYLWKSYSGNW